MNAADFVKSKYLKAGDMEVGTTARVRIADVTQEEMGEDRENKLCLHFVGMEQALALNRTQTKRMIELFGTSTDGWINMTINLMVIPTTFKGDQVNTFAIAPVNGQSKAPAGNNPFAGRQYTDTEAPPVTEDLPF